MSGVADHYAEDDEEAIAITRSIVSSLGDMKSLTSPAAERAGSLLRVTSPEETPSPPGPATELSWEEPLYDPSEMGSIIPTDPKRPFDVRDISACMEFPETVRESRGFEHQAGEGANGLH